MKYELPELNYPYDALEPYLDAKTMEIHHGKHHQAYTDKMNAILEKYPDLTEAPEVLMGKLDSLDMAEADKQAFVNHGGGYINHNLFWKAMDPSNRKDEKLVEEIGKIIDLPKDETPLFRNVVDPQKLKDEPFFANAQVDDKVLIYSNAKKAYLYRPSEKKMINFASINIGEQTSTPASPAQQETKFVILNGTTTAGLAGKYRDIVSQKITGAKIVSVGNYSEKTIEKTFIAQSTNTNSDKQEEIAKTLEIQTGAINSDQIDDEADFIIVVGANKSSI